jgi:hypothetical protein
VSARSLCAGAEIGAGALLVAAALYVIVRVLQLGHADPHGILYLLAIVVGGLGLLLLVAGFGLRAGGARAWWAQVPWLLWAGAVLWYVLRLQ